MTKFKNISNFSMDQINFLKTKDKNQTGAKVSRSISITSGKGGVGKTSFSINFAFELAKNGKNCLLIDCDFGLANIDIMLNIPVQKTTEDILSGKATIEEVIVQVAPGLDVLPAVSGMPEVADMDLERQKFFIKQIAKIQDNYDFLIFDTGAGIHRQILRINAASDFIIVVTNPETPAITDAYSILKVLCQNYKIHSFALVVNQADSDQGKAVHNLLSNVAKDHGVLFKLKFLGAISKDKVVQESIQKRTFWKKVKPSANCIQDLSQIVYNFLTGQTVELNEKFIDKMRFWKKIFTKN